MLDLVKNSWEEIMDNLRDNYKIPSVSFKIWLSTLSPVKVYEVVPDQDNPFEYTLVLLAVSTGLDIISERYENHIRSAIADILDIGFNIEFVSGYSEKEAPAEDPKPVQEKPRVNNSFIVNSNDSKYASYTFDNYVVSSNNAFAHGAALKVAEAPGRYHNPLFIYGNSGLGKTHLLCAIANYVAENSPNLKGLYVSSTDFLNELIDAIRQGKTAPSNFREKYRNVDIFLIDDIQSIIGKENTQEEFFQTFNSLYEAGKQIVISSDKPPKDMAALDERFRSRFSWGLIAELTPPDYETRMAILKKKVELNQKEFYDYDIDDTVLEYIAANVISNVRSLEGALNTLNARARLQRCNPNLELAQVSLQEYINPEKEREISPEFIINIVAEHFNISVDDIRSEKRNKEVAYPRQIAMYLCRTLTKKTVTDLGKIYFNKDHSTVMHGSDKIVNMLLTNVDTQKTIGVLKNKINP